MNYDLPTSLEVCGVEYEIRSDYRAVLDICTALSDPSLNDKEKSLVCLEIMYKDFEKIPVNQYGEALKKCFWFIRCGEEEEEGNTTKLMDWEQDFPYIVAPVNRIMGVEIRSLKYLHWWSFISAYYEIGDCLFSQITRIRYKLAKGRTLDKEERKWYNEHRSLVDLKTKYSEAEEQLLREWGCLNG